jgi:hypothetical protein
MRGYARAREGVTGGRDNERVRLMRPLAKRCEGVWCMWEMRGCRALGAPFSQDYSTNNGCKKSKAWEQHTATHLECQEAVMPCRSMAALLTAQQQRHSAVRRRPWGGAIGGQQSGTFAC